MEIDRFLVRNFGTGFSPGSRPKLFIPYIENLWVYDWLSCERTGKSLDFKETMPKIVKVQRVYGRSRDKEVEKIKGMHEKIGRWSRKMTEVSPENMAGKCRMNFALKSVDCEKIVKKNKGSQWRRVIKDFDRKIF